MKDFFYQYADKGYIVIPVNHKLPTIDDWNNIDTTRDQYELIDEWFETTTKPITGLSMLLGQRYNRRLACVDIDSNDYEIVTRILENFPSAFRKIGRKGCTFFFLTDGEQTKSSYRFKCPDGKGFVEVFYENKQIVLPPSLHSEDEETGEVHHYYWDNDNYSLLTVDYDELPVIPFAQIETIPILIGSASTATANANLPRNLQYNNSGEADGRYAEMLAHFGRLVKKYNQRPKLSQIITEMLDFDAKICPKNSFFLYDYNKKRAEIKTNDRAINATAWCASVMRTFHQNSGATFDESNEAIPTESIGFNKLVPLRETMEKDAPLTFDEKLIPPIWRGMICEMSSAMGVGTYPLFMSFLCALGACTQSKARIQPVKTDEFHQFPNLAVCLVAHSGSKKSDVLAVANRECRQINKDLKKVNSSKMLSEMEVIQSRIEALFKTKKKLASEGMMEEAKAIDAEVHALQEELEKLGIKSTIWMYEISTIQKMINDAVKCQENGLYLELDEFKQIIAMMKKKGNEDARTFFMKGIDGNKDFSYSTIARGQDYIEKHRVSILTSIQPDVLSVYIGDMNNPRMTDNDGFFQRFQFVSFGDPSLQRAGNIDFRRYHKEYNVFRNAFHFAPSVVHVDEAALECYEDARQETRARSFEFFGKPVGSFLSKHEGLLCRYAYLYQVLINEGRIVSTISSEAITMALALLGHVAEDTKRQFNISDGIVKKNDLEKIIRLIRMGSIKDGQTVREIHRLIMSEGMKTVDTEIVVNELELRGYLAQIQVAVNSKQVFINPQVYTL